MITRRKIPWIANLILFVLLAVLSINAGAIVDTTFNGAAYGELANQGNINVVKVLPDGKVLIGGKFTEVQGFAASGLARLNADGTVDKTFVAPDFASHDPNTGATTFGAEIFAVAVQPDGKIIAGGNIYIGIFGMTGVRLGIKRLNPDGSMDSTFATELMLFGSSVNDIKLQADGKILLGGLFTLDSSTTTKNLARLNANGTHDTSFTADTSNTRVRELEIQPDGKVIAGGYNGTTPTVRRYGTDGSSDSSFSSTIAGNGILETLKLQADGKILVAGNYTNFGGSVQGRISRLNADGSVDLTFNTSGSGASGIVNDLEIRPDGKIIIGGDFAAFNGTAMQRIARLNADGTLDSAFTNGGTNTANPVNDVALLTDDRILAGSNTSTLVNPLLRFSADGAFDSSFVVRANRGGKIHKFLQQPDGKILVVGEFLYANGLERRSMARLNADGTLDASFVPYFNNLPVLQIINAIALQTDGKIIVGTSNGIVLQRLNPDGSHDMSFNAALPSSSNVSDVLVQADGKILVGGLMTFVLPTFARFNPDGTRDTGFNPGQPNFWVKKILIQPDGKILIGGLFSAISDIGFRSRVARFSAEGVLDSTFVPPTSNPSVLDLDLQADGKVVIGGTGIRRLNSDGTADPSLDVGANGEIDAVKIQPNGKIIVGGNFSVIGTTPKNGIVRFNPNGSLDTGFTTFANRGVLDVGLQSDGKILIAGSFSKIDGVPGVRIARLIDVPDQAQFDYDGDGRADLSVFRPSTNRWYIFRSSDFTVTEQTFGASGDIITPADYDGDGKTDRAIFRPSSGDWWYTSSINNAQVQSHWGQSGDIPRPGDFDGDGKADFVIFRPSENNWYRFGTTAGISIVNFGAAGDKPVTGDFDGDGKADVAIYRPSNGTWWYQSSVNNAQLAVQFGISSDIPSPADYDGDGKTDIAVYRPSTGVWYIINSGNGSITIIQFGIAEDKPVAADYDGDGKADIAVFRPSTGVWYLLRSTAGFSASQFGISTDIPTENAFVP